MQNLKGKDDPPSTSNGPPRAPRPRVLVADDEIALLSAVERSLTQAGFDVSVAQNGDEALALLDEAAFDAVLCDVQMPGVTGVALLRAARERDLEVPVLLMTGMPDVESAAEAVRLGAAQYLVKPVPLDLFERVLRKAIALSGLARAKRESIRVLDTNRPEAGDRAGLEITLDRALRSTWIAYQPIVDVTKRSILAYEALLRSTEPALPHPGAVLDAAERLGRLQDVGRTVRRLAPEPMKETATLLFVNLHALDLLDDDLVATSSSLAIMAPRVVLEITERASLDGIADVRERVARLRRTGFRIAIDDLGAGYAGLTSFAQLEPEFVKLDMSLVRDVHQHAVKRKLIRSMTTLCTEIGIAVIAEGVETQSERDALVDLGCDLLQGYLFARPGAPFPVVSW